MSPSPGPGPDPGEQPVLDAPAILAVLQRHEVDHVVVGGYAAELHGSRRRTVDVDVVPATTQENLTRLAAALAELDARIRTETHPGGLPFATSPEALAGMSMLNLVTRHGELDLTFTPAGTAGYPDLARSAIPITVGQVEVRIAALADVIRSKTAAGRRKDADALPELHALAAGRSPRAGAGAERSHPVDVAAPSFPAPPAALSPEQAAAARITAAKAQAQADRERRAKPPSR